MKKRERERQREREREREIERSELLDNESKLLDLRTVATVRNSETQQEQQMNNCLHSETLRFLRRSSHPGASPYTALCHSMRALLLWRVCCLLLRPYKLERKRGNQKYAVAVSQAPAPAQHT